MYAQAIRTPPVYRHRRANNQAHLNMFKGCAFSNEPCDCIKSLKLGEKTLPTLIQTNETEISTQIDAFFESKPKIDAFLKIDANAQRQEYKMAS